MENIIHTYNITAENVIEIIDSETNKTVVIQPNWPNGEPFADREQAESWAKICAEAMSNHKSKFVPGMSPENHPVLRLIPDTTEPAADTEA